jgi:hypothetical protein
MDALGLVNGLNPTKTTLHAKSLEQFRELSRIQDDLEVHAGG